MNDKVAKAGSELATPTALYAIMAYVACVRSVAVAIIAVGAAGNTHSDRMLFMKKNRRQIRSAKIL